MHKFWRETFCWKFMTSWTEISVGSLTRTCFWGRSSRGKLDSNETFRMIKILIFRLASWAYAVKTNNTLKSWSHYGRKYSSNLNKRQTSLLVKFSFQRGDSVHIAIKWRCRRRLSGNFLSIDLLFQQRLCYLRWEIFHHKGFHKFAELSTLRLCLSFSSKTLLPCLHHNNDNEE